MLLEKNLTPFRKYLEQGLPNVLVVNGVPSEKWHQKYDPQERYDYLNENEF